MLFLTFAADLYLMAFTMELTPDLVFEIIGTIIGLTYLYLEYKANMWLWPMGILMSVFYVIIFFKGNFYADAAVYLYYVGANSYGWYVWRKNSKIHSPDAQVDSLDNQDAITHIPMRTWLPVVMVSLTLWAALYAILSHIPTSAVPLGDSFTTALSVVAMWLLAKKYVEQWLFWIVVNVVSMSLYLYKGLYPTALLYAVYVVVAVLGLIKWNRMATKANA